MNTNTVADVDSFNNTLLLCRISLNRINFKLSCKAKSADNPVDRKISLLKLDLIYIHLA